MGGLKQNRRQVAHIKKSQSNVSLASSSINKQSVKKNSYKRKKNEPLDMQMLRDTQVVAKSDIVSSAKLSQSKEKGNIQKIQKRNFFGLGNEENQPSILNESDTENMYDEAYSKEAAMDEKMANKVLSQAKLQMLEVEDEETKNTYDFHSRGKRIDFFKDTEKVPHSVKFDRQNTKLEKDSDEAYTSDSEIEGENEPFYLAQDSSIESMSAHDRELFERWSNPQTSFSEKSLADLILEKLQERTISSTDEPGLTISPSTNDHNTYSDVPPINEKVVEIYSKLGLLLSRYKSGKLPKAFKVLPSLLHWEKILSYAQPDTWTPNAVYQATRLFSSTLKPHLAQRFYTAILLPHVRKELKESRKLSFHYYEAMKKAMYKPSAFFKGILLPLCESGDTTLREAGILSSLLAKMSIPVLHASAGLVKILELPYSGANSIFIRVIIDKKYTLPCRCIDALVTHFSQFKHDARELFVLWHQSLLVFVQRYKEELTRAQKQALTELIHIKRHHLVSPEILRELNDSKCRQDDLDTNIDHPMS